jgi:hypothetical protein
VLQRIFAAGPACLLNGAAQAAGRFLIIGALLAQALLGTLKRADGIIQGWGKHYRFCNDQPCFEILDRKVDVLIREYLGFYGVERRRTDEGRACLTCSVSSGWLFSSGRHSSGQAQVCGTLRRRGRTRHGVGARNVAHARFSYIPVRTDGGKVIPGKNTAPSRALRAVSRGKAACPLFNVL